MKLARLALVAVFTAASVSSVSAQTYGPATPQPRTTDPGALQALARAREVRERFIIGIEAEGRRDWAAAASEFERIISLRPSEPQFSTAYYDLGIAYANQRRYDAAATAFRTAIDRDSQFLAAMANLISVDLARGAMQEARSVADRFAALAPDSARALYSRGLVALRQGDYAQARESFARLLRSDPAYAIAHYDLALAQAATGRYFDAERELHIALDLAPNYVRARFALGTVLLHLGKREVAQEAFAAVAGDVRADIALRNLASAMRDTLHSPR